MPPLDLSSRAVALLSAALRHVRDATWLADPANPGCSPDQAWHLAGYGPECARKATLSRRDFDKTIGHRFRASTETVVDIVVSLDPHAHRYAPSNWAIRFPALASWQEGARYDGTGSYTLAAVTPLIAEARRAVDDVILALWADGRVPAGARLW